MASYLFPCSCPELHIDRPSNTAIHAESSSASPSYLPPDVRKSHRALEVEMNDYDEKKEVTYLEDGPGYSGPRRGSRIDAPIRKTSTFAGEGDTSSDEEGMSVAKQLELEKGNAIQYRTCSWPKVRFSRHTRMNSWTCNVCSIHIMSVLA